MSDQPARILVVDDLPENVRLLEAVLEPQGYEIFSATDGSTALELAVSAKPDLVLLDVMMPPPDGHAVCRRLREQEETAVLPVIMLTASEGSEKTKAIEAGADDFITKPFNRDELLTRIRSLLRIKRYHDTIKAQAAELLELNRTLEERVQAQLEELERLQRLRRFLSPQLADAIVSSGDESILQSHRRQVAMFFADLRGWTSFVDAVEPEELMRVLGEFHGVIGELVSRFDATVGFIEGDGVQLFFNDPIEVPDAALRATRLGCALRAEMAELMPIWRKRGYDLDFGAGIALGYATCGDACGHSRAVAQATVAGASTSSSGRKGSATATPCRVSTRSVRGGAVIVAQVSAGAVNSMPAILPTKGLVVWSRVSTSSIVPGPACTSTTRRFIARVTILASTVRSLLVQVIRTVSAMAQPTLIAARPAYFAIGPSSSSMRMSWLYWRAGRSATANRS